MSTCTTDFAAANKLASHIRDLKPRLESLQRDLAALQSEVGTTFLWPQIGQAAPVIKSMLAELYDIEDEIEEEFPGLTATSDAIEAVNTFLSISHDELEIDHV
jgi:predicted  nucleic acid-binding Zn-ribbon protein